jgi:serine protease inhibitor
VTYPHLFLQKPSIPSTTLIFSSKDVELLPAYKDALNKNNIKSIEGFNFSNYELINEHMKNATGGLIEEIVGEGSLDKDTKVIVVNGVYFEVRISSFILCACFDTFRFII